MSAVNFDKKYDSEAAKRAGFELMLQELYSAEYGMHSVAPYPGDGGVEAFRSVDGKNEGMQAKYFDREKLTSSDKSQIQKSLKKAVKEWAPLSKYFINLPRNLEKDSIAWVLNTLKTKVEGASEVEIILATKTEHEILMAKHSYIKAKYKQDFQTLHEDIQKLMDNKNSADLKVEDFKRFIEKGYIKVQSGFPGEVLTAFEYLESLIIIEKFNPEVRDNLIALKLKALYTAERIYDAKELALSTVKDNENNIDALLTLAEIAMDSRDKKTFKELVSKAKLVNEENPNYRNILLSGQINFKDEDIKLSSDTWGTPGTVQRAHMHYLKSVYYSSKQQETERDQEIELALNNSPKHTTYKYELSKINFALKDLIHKVQSEKKVDSNVISEINELLTKVGKLNEVVSTQEAPTYKLLLNAYKLDLFLLLYQNDAVNGSEMKRVIDLALEFIQLSWFDFNIAHTLYAILCYPPIFFTPDILASITSYLTSIREPNESMKDSVSQLSLLYVALRVKIPDELIILLKIFKLDFISEITTKLETKNVDEIKKLLGGIDLDFQKRIAVYLPTQELREVLFEHMGMDKTDLEKIKAYFLFDAKQFEQSLLALSSVNLREESYITCKVIAESAYKIGLHGKAREAFRRLLELGSSESENIVNKYKLAESLFYLKEFPEFKKLAVEILNSDKLTNGKSWMLVLYLDTLVGEGDIPNAIKSVSDYQHIADDLPSRVQLAEVYTANEEYELALEQIQEAVYAVKELRRSDHLGILHTLFEIENAAPEIVKTKSKIISEGKFVKLEGESMPWLFVGEGQNLGVQNILKGDERYKVLLSKNEGDLIEWPADRHTSRERRKILFVCDLFEYLTRRGYEEIANDANSGSPYVTIIESKTAEEMGEKVSNFVGKDDQLLKEFEDSNLPFFTLSSQIHSVGKALYIFSQSQKAVLPAVGGTKEALNHQIELIEEALSKEMKIYLDGTSLVLLAESGILDEFLSKFQNVCIPTSVVEEYRSLAEKFSKVPKRGLTQMGHHNGKLIIDEYDQSTAHKIGENIKKTLKIIEEKAKVFSVPNEEKSEKWIENNVYPAASDAAIKSMGDVGSLLITEDHKYPLFNNFVTGKPIPNMASTIALVRYLFHQGAINMEQYTNTICVLSKYRLSFISISSNDLYSLLFESNESGLIIVNQEKLTKLNLKLLFNETYGSSAESIGLIVAGALIRCIQDGTLYEISLKPINHILNSIKDRSDSKKILMLIKAAINKFFESKMILYPTFEENLKIINERLDLLIAGKYLL